MTAKNQRRSNIPRLGNSTNKGGIRFLLVLLLLGTFSFFSAAQERYTVNRPVLQPLTEVLPEIIHQRALEIQWKTDYEYARQEAETATRLLLIYLYAEHNLPKSFEAEQGEHIPNEDAHVQQQPQVSPAEQILLSKAAACYEFDTVVLNDIFVHSGLDRYVLLKLPMDMKITAEDGTEAPILLLPGFEHMAGYPGLVVIDFANRNAPYYKQVTGILPFWRAACPTAEQTTIFLDLPPGTLTQRTLTYAVRSHPDKPLSGNGKPLPAVVQAATDHALFQAERGVIGHHNFGARSRKVIDKLGGGRPSEICAQTRSTDSIYEGAIHSMRLWRHSPAHWSVARKSHRYYGYDMVQGRNGAWYAVGFFID